MELMKKNIHMDRIRLSTETQISLEDDRNIPDVKPDVNALVYEQGQVKIDEIKPSDGHVTVKGRLLFTVLYQTTEGEVALAGVSGEIPFEEQIFLEGVTPSDHVEVTARIEDLKANTINSRKINIQAVIDLSVKSEEFYEEEAAMDIYQDEPVEYRRQPMELAQLAIRKNDIFRLKEEVPLPSNYPNVFEVIFSTVTLNDVEFKALDEKISVQGDMHLFVLYEGEGEDQPIRTFETVIPFSGILECSGCREAMIPDIRYEVGHLEIDAKPDFDGEERIIGVEMVLDIMMRLYEEERVEMLTDVYGVTREVETHLKTVELKQLLARNTGKCKLTQHIRMEESDPRVLQILHTEGNVELDDCQVVEDGLLVNGSVLVKVLYVTGDDGRPYGSIRRQLPFTYTLEVPGIRGDDLYTLQPELEQLAITMLDSEELDVKGVVALKTTVFRKILKEIIDQITVGELDANLLNELPGIVVYVVQPGDSLWKIGKRYYVSVDAIKEMNNLTSDEIRPGDKLLIVKYPNGDG